ncbi:MAG: hypothetical protein P8J50_12160 [Acidimicrobiales bacterium]|nr:hypothetical protein [Acidimicrobiales bacterium]
MLATIPSATSDGIDVMAVPGSVRNGAAIGTNQLLAEGCAPVRDVDDVTTALGLTEATTAARSAPNVMAEPDNPVLCAIDDGPTSIDEIVARSGLTAAEVAAEIARLELDGLVCADGARVRRT